MGAKGCGCVAIKPNIRKQEARFGPWPLIRTSSHGKHYVLSVPLQQSSDLLLAGFPWPAFAQDVSSRFINFNLFYVFVLGRFSYKQHLARLGFLHLSWCSFHLSFSQSLIYLEWLPPSPFMVFPAFSQFLLPPPLLSLGLISVVNMWLDLLTGLPISLISLSAFQPELKVYSSRKCWHWLLWGIPERSQPGTPFG